MDSTWLRIMKPFIQFRKRQKARYLFRRKVQTVEINAADSTGFSSLPGIGPVLSKRLLSFRNALGGFHSVQQISECWGLRDSTFQAIRQYLICDSTWQTIDINTLSVDSLKLHPYIKYRTAQIIVLYRDQNGSFNSFKEMEKLYGLDTVFLRRIKPYLSFRE